ncbi:MAG: HupE/UreJ family protein [Curvibacter sp.]|nr:HupE/UreJ family protein [Curvibacter sp.]
MKTRRIAAPLLAALGLLALGTAQAHPGHGPESFASGLAHPFSGLDHLLAMLAVGVWSTLALPAGRRLLGPALFLLCLLAGAGLGLAGLQLPGTEAGVALTVSLFGVLLLAGPRTGLGTGLGLIAAAGLLHGLAHGSEAAAGTLWAAYAAGFMLASGLLHGLGLAAGAGLQRLPLWALRGLAGGLGASGLVMLAGRV